MMTNKRGAASLAEYAIIILVVVAVGMGMTTYVRRSLQARMRDARQYMIASVNTACDASCQQAANIVGRGVRGQYEPYYTQVNSAINADSVSTRRLVATEGTNPGNFIVELNSQTQSDSNSKQLSPMQSVNDQY
ncbi:MAG: hypothetical protein HQL15_10280 [Candidatus Omnitrophica bacterium]|nr:hypothetical protein [Candidatus Omnitrophota bacterium]